jgi:hypothetical protein
MRQCSEQQAQCGDPTLANGTVDGNQGSRGAGSTEGGDKVGVASGCAGRQLLVERGCMAKIYD